MAELIEEFKREHSEIIDSLNEVKEHGILAKESKAKLRSIKLSLIEHLGVEDEKFYPVLWKEAKQNNKLKEKLEIFAKDLKNVYKVAFDFFDRYENGFFGTRLLEAFETLFTVLRYRMENEENILYEEYNKLT